MNKSPDLRCKSSIQNNSEETEKNINGRRWTDVAEKNQLTNEQRRKEMAEKLWLNYFNDTLFQQSIITEAERNRLKSKINSRKPSLHNNHSRAVLR